MTTDVWQNVGKTVAFDLQEGADLRFEGAAGALLSREYSLGDGADFTTAFKLGIDPVVSLDAARMRIKLTVGNDTGRQCAYSDTFQTTDLVAVNVYSKQFALAGFNAVAFTTAMPEPATWWTLLTGLLAIGFANQRRAKGTRQDCRSASLASPAWQWLRRRVAKAASPGSALGCGLGAAGVIGGKLTLHGQLTHNGIVCAGRDATVLMRRGMASNAGKIQLTGRGIDNNGFAISNEIGAVVSGFGTLRGGQLTNQGKVLLSSGSSTI